MSKSLRTVQTVCKVCKVLAEIVFVLLVVGAVLMLACGIFIGAGKMDALLSSGALVLDEMLQQSGATQEYVTAVFVCLTIIIAAEAVVAKFINVYFKHELKAGTPFTFEGAKEMLLVEEADNKEFLCGLFNAMYDELPVPKPKKKK